MSRAPNYEHQAHQMAAGHFTAQRPPVASPGPVQSSPVQSYQPIIPHDCPFSRSPTPLHGQTLNLVAQGTDLGVEVRGLVRREGNGDHGTRDTAGTAESDLAGNVLQPPSVILIII